MGLQCSQRNNFYPCIYRGRSRTAATFKVECFVRIVNGFQLLTIITKHSILDVAVGQDLFLHLYFKNVIAKTFSCFQTSGIAQSPVSQFIYMCLYFWHGIVSCKSVYFVFYQKKMLGMAINKFSLHAQYCLPTRQLNTMVNTLKLGQIYLDLVPKQADKYNYSKSSESSESRSNSESIKSTNFLFFFFIFTLFQINLGNLFLSDFMTESILIAAMQV